MSLGTAWAFQPLVSGARTPPARSWGFRDGERPMGSRSLGSVPQSENMRRRKARAARLRVPAVGTVASVPATELPAAGGRVYAARNASVPVQRPVRLGKGIIYSCTVSLKETTAQIFRDVQSGTRMTEEV